MTDPSDAGLSRRIEAFGRFVRAVDGHVNSTAPMDAGQIDAAGAFVERATNRLRLCAGGHTVVALAGATGGGKSTLFNALAGIHLSPTGQLRPTTGEVHACVWGPQPTDQLLDWLGVAARRRSVRESVLDAEDHLALRGLVLLDLPDVDSIAVDNRLEAERLVGVVDLVIWVLDPQKYADQTVHDEYLRRMDALRGVTVVVLNQIDRLSPADAARCRDDLARIVASDGLTGVSVLPISALHGDGVGAVRALLEKTVGERQAARSRLESELDASVTALAPLVAATGSPDAGGGEVDAMRDAIRDMAESFAAAAGVPAVASAAARAYVRRAAVPGWPFRRAETEPADPARFISPDDASDVLPAEPTAVEQAVRRLAATTTAGLPAPWPDEVRSAAGADVDQVPDELGRALRAARPRQPRATGWWVARLLWWLSIASAVVGAGWLARPAVDRLVGGATPDLLDVRGMAVPWLMVAGGLAGAILLMLVGRPVAALRARRVRSATERQLRDAAAAVAREVATPVRGVLRDYANAAAALGAARRRGDAINPQRRPDSDLHGDMPDLRARPSH